MKRIILHLNSEVSKLVWVYKRVFYLQTFARRIMKSKIFGTKEASGPLAEDQIKPTRTFLSSERHSNTTSEDLSEIWNISVEQAKMT